VATSFALAIFTSLNDDEVGVGWLLPLRSAFDEQTSAITFLYYESSRTFICASMEEIQRLENSRDI
jgi:hypothetical protein